MFTIDQNITITTKIFRVWPYLVGLVVFPDQFPALDSHHTSPYKNGLSQTISPYKNAIDTQELDLREGKPQLDLDAKLIKLYPREKIKNIPSVEDGVVAKAPGTVKNFKTNNKIKKLVGDDTPYSIKNNDTNYDSTYTPVVY